MKVWVSLLELSDTSQLLITSSPKWKKINRLFFYHIPPLNSPPCYSLNIQTYHVLSVFPSSSPLLNYEIFRVISPVVPSFKLMQAWF